MKKYLTQILIVSLFYSCETSRSIEEIKSDFGSFEGKTIKMLPTDYTKTPIYNAVKHHPENYTYLEKIDIFSIGHISDGLFLKGFMVAPKKEGKYPVIVFNRGGNQDLGLLTFATAVNIMAPIAAEGYVVVATNYRGNSYGEGIEEFGGDDVNDIANLIQSMAEVENADTSRVGLLGLSRGGMMNYLTLKEKFTSNIKAIVCLGGITDLETTIKYHPQIEEVAKELIPDFKVNRDIEIEKRSVVKWVDKLPLSVPILVLHGMKDEHVNYSQIPPFINQLQKFKIPFKSIAFKEGSHGIKEYREEVNNLIKDWFEKYVKDIEEFKEPVTDIIIE